jgi:anti-sigma factor RsiW
MGTTQEPHPTQEVIENYLLGKLDEGQSALVEEHLLSCPACVDVARALDDYVRAMRKALEERLPKARAARKGK